jgi:tripartite-type tricarboxylate transporter receptor subunit TctC
MDRRVRKQDSFGINRKGLAVKGWTLHRKSFLLVILIIGFLSGSQGAQSQEYPTRPITLIISFAPGAGTDVCGRAMIQGATRTLGQEIIPVNKPGAGGAVGTGIVATSKPDGYTLLATSTSVLTIIPHMEQVTYDPVKDVIPIIQFGVVNNGIVVRSDSPHKSFKDLVDFARRNPGKVSCGVVGVGTPPHLDIELLKMEGNVDISIIPFGGAVPTMTALLGGHITTAGVGASAWMSYFKAGKVRILATTTEKRIIPEVPTLYELGYPYYGCSTELHIIAAPKGISSAVMKKLEGAFQKAEETPEFRKSAESFYIYVPNPLSGQRLKEFIENLHAKNGEIIWKAKLGR